MKEPHLSDIILHGSAAQLNAALNQGAEPNGEDPYGYTPLIEAGIVDDAEKAQLLIAHGADVKAQDITGGTALHWAVENQNLKLAQLLLDHGADPNAFTTASESCLVKPLLRHQNDMRDLLVKYGGKIQFAQDFIHAKLLGHRFELMGAVDIQTPKGEFTEVDLEGFFLEFSIDIMADSVSAFMRNYAARHLKPYKQALTMVHQSLINARELIGYQHYRTDAEQHRDRIAQLLQSDLLIIPVAFQGHAMSFVRLGPLLAKCDRRKVGDFADSILISKINDAHYLNYDLLKTLMYERHRNAMIESRLQQILKLEPLMHLMIRRQITGNCSWANIEAAVPSALFLLTHDFSQGLPEVIADDHPALDVYRQWTQWDKSRALKYCLDSFYEADEARKASKAALLAAVLFQRCGVKNPEDVMRAKKIIKALKTPGYEYILENYVQTYHRDKRTEAGDNLLKLIEQFKEF